MSQLVGLLLCALSACDKASEPEPPQKEPTPTSAVSPATGPAPWKLPAAERLVAFGDVHGDLAATRRALRLAGAIDEGDRWIGGKLVVVQTGDQLDRGDDERQILDLFERLVAAARAAGGAFHPLNGNHETMNVQADFRYVTSVGFSQFADAEVSERTSLVERFLPQMRGRAAAFLPGGLYAKKLAERPVVLMVGDTVFAHGGVLSAHVQDITHLNEDTRGWMLGQRTAVPSLIESGDGPVWTRAYGAPNPDASACAELDRTLAAVGAKRMVVGHSVQDNGISPACGEKVWRIDMGLAAYYGGKAAQVLEITSGGARVLREAEPAALRPKAASGF